MKSKSIYSLALDIGISETSLRNYLKDKASIKTKKIIENYFNKVNYEILNIEQGTDEWYNVRLGKLTASNAQTIYASGKGLETLCLELISEYYSSETPEQITSPDIERGKELEFVARELYCLKTGEDVKEVGFININDYIGCSPDGVIYNNGKITKSIEIKCPKDRKYLDVLLNGYIDPKYYAQMQHQMYCLSTLEVDYVVYNPHFKQDLIIITVKRDDEFIEKLKNGLYRGQEILEKLHKKMKGIK